MPPISDCDANFGNNILKKNSKWYWYPMAVRDEYLYKILNYLGASFSDMCNSQIEGSFYRRELFQEIVAVINKVYRYEAVLNKNKIVYPREEVYYPTIANILGKSRSLKIIQPNYTFVAWRNKGFLPTAQQITDIAQGKVKGRYAVKRVSRKIDDPTRVYIGTQIGNYREQTLNLINNKERMDNND